MSVNRFLLFFIQIVSFPIESYGFGCSQSLEYDDDNFPLEFKATETILLQLIPFCTIEFYGPIKTSKLLLRVHQICRNINNAYIPIAYCVSLFTTDNTILKWEYGPFPAIGYIANSTSNKKHLPSCNAMITNIIHPFSTAQHFKNVELLSLLKLDSYESGKVVPDYIFVWLPKDYLKPNFSTDGYFINSLSNSKLFVVDDMFPANLLLYCLPCNLTVNIVQHHDQNKAGSKNESCIKGVMANLGDFIKLGPSETIQLETIQHIWNDHHLNLHNWKDLNGAQNENSANTVCGPVTVGILNYIKQEYGYENLFSNGRSGLEHLDPQKVCLYMTILQKHNFRGLGPSFKIIRQFLGIPVPRLPYYGEIPIENRRQPGVKGDVCFADGSHTQSYHYAVFLSKSLLQLEFDLKAVSRPLDGYCWALIFILLVLIELGIFRLTPGVPRLFTIAILFEQGVRFKGCKKWQGLLSLALWMLSALQLRLAYTGCNYSFLTTSTHPKIPPTLEEILGQVGEEKMGIFSSYKEFPDLHELIKIMLGKVELLNGNAFKFWSRLNRDLQILNDADIAEILKHDKKTFIKMPMKNSFKLFDRFVLVTKTEISRHSARRYKKPDYGSEGGSAFDKNGAGGGGGYPAPNVTNTSIAVPGNSGYGGGSQSGCPEYVHHSPQSNLLNECATIYAYQMSQEDPEWAPDLPFELTLMASDIFMHRMNSDSSAKIPARVWLFQGKKDFFTKFFYKDLGSLIHSGIYQRWQQLRDENVERDYIQNIQKGTPGATLKRGESSSTSWHSRFSWITFEKVNNYSLRVIWSLYLLCVVISVVAYFKEICVLSIPGVTM